MGAGEDEKEEEDEVVVVAAAAAATAVVVEAAVRPVLDQRGGCRRSGRTDQLTGWLD